MRAIYKYRLPFKSEQTIELPVGSKVLSVGQQEQGLVIWAEVNPKEEEKEAVFFYTYATGEEYLQHGSGSVFLGTVQIPLAYEYVIHVFYEKLSV